MHANLDMDPNRVSVHCFGLGGASFRSGSKCIVHYVNTVMSQLTFSLTVVFLHVGENDIMSASANSLCDNLQSLIHQLSVAFCVQLMYWRSVHRAVKTALERVTSNGR
jgi:hypothetical protein